MTGINPNGVIPHISAQLTLDYRYPCGPLCRGLPVAPWLIPPAKVALVAPVAPMVELDLALQLAQDVSTLPESPSQF